MEEINYTLQECQEFNQERHNYIQQFIRGNYDPKAELKPIVMPDEANPWNILHAVINQFYEREHEIAQTVHIARCDLEHAKELTSYCHKSEELYWNMQKEIGDLRQENERLKETLSLQEESPEPPSKVLQELLQTDGAHEWAECMGDILDSLISALSCIDSDRLHDNLFYARTLQKFFLELEKEIENHS